MGIPLDSIHIALFISYGEVLEWLKRHAWKACKRQKRFGGSNPPLSAKGNPKGFPFFYFLIVFDILLYY